MIKQRKLGWQYGAGVAVIGASVGALFAMRSCSKLQVEPVAIECPEVKTQKVEPPKTDGKCEVDKGEHDVFSPIYSLSDCGYCGNNKQDGSWETQENCEVDFLCGDKKIQYNAKTYAGIVEENGSYKYGLITYSESCVSSAKNYCDFDCTGKSRPTTTSTNTPDIGTTPKTKPDSPKPKGQCPQGLSDSELVGRITSNISSNSASIRNAAGGEGAPITAYVSVNISGDGIPTLGGSFVKCGGSNCPSAVSPATVSNLSLGGIRVGGMTGEGCTKTYSATVR